MEKIPKIIHYCWFGANEKPDLVKKCIQSWKHFCPNYQFIEWNEGKFNINENAFVKEAYEAKQWAFVSDYVRLYALQTYGGIYLDTDMELLQPLDCFLGNDCFLGFEVNDLLAAGIIGCEKGHFLIREFFAFYQDKHFGENGKRTIAPSPMILTRIMVEQGLKTNGKEQVIEGCAVYPKDVFYPTGLNWVLNRYSPKTHAVHHYMDSWGKKPSQGKRLFFARVRLSAVHLGRNIFGTNAMFEAGKKLRKVKSLMRQR